MTNTNESTKQSRLTPLQILEQSRLLDVAVEELGKELELLLNRLEPVSSAKLAGPKENSIVDARKELLCLYAGQLQGHVLRIRGLRDRVMEMIEHLEI